MSCSNCWRWSGPCQDCAETNKQAALLEAIERFADDIVERTIREIRDRETND